ncbi:type III pantothenate kinase [Methylomonas methanica]|uniref:Type III pantothenate kinase n=1 Tax=Methylomonas methanica (strain DSM 25384 / MC09) TaxID=857087 RepID=G0A1N5_METMM|nr:type III pantothenate kinase [Methylomonas methanica]AEG00096.1 putative transcriptional acitvator, Baf family [Methylomonas methanica MC09]
MNLLLDIGNTRLKWATEDQGQIDESHACDYRQPGCLASLERAWRGISVSRNLAIASVSEKQVLDSLIQLGQTLWPQCRLLIPQASAAAFGVTNAYQQPEKLGIDRWLAMIAAHNLYPGNVCVVDCGTAVTLDVVRADGRHLGGLICPGLNVMKQALVSNTADLMFTQRSYDTELGSATDVAIANGVCAAVIGLIEHTLSKLDADYRLVLTGGDAAYLVDLLRVSVSYDRDLVLKGLSIFCRGDANL